MKLQVNSHVRNNTSLKSAKNCANWCKGFKDVCIRVQWPSMILHVKLGLLTLSLDGATFSYKVDEYRVNKCIEDQTALKCPKIIKKNWSMDFEEVSSQTYSALVFWPSCKSTVTVFLRATSKQETHNIP